VSSKVVAKARPGGLHHRYDLAAGASAGNTSCRS
jgi:hypothetical protein